MQVVKVMKIYTCKVELIKVAASNLHLILHLTVLGR